MRIRPKLPMVSAVILAAILAATAAWLALNTTARAQTTLPAPADVSAVNGDDSGQVVVSWDAVDEASSYSVRWVNLGAAWDAYRAGLEWTKLIQSVDIEDSGDTTNTLTVNNLTPGTQYSFGVGSKITAGANPNWSSWVSFTPAGDDGTTDVQDVVHLQSAALALVQNANALVGVGSVPTDASMTRASIGQDMAAVGRLKGTLNTELAILKAKGPESRVGYIEALVGRLVSNVDTIQQGRGPLLRALQAEGMSRSTLTRDNSAVLFPRAGASVDMQFYDLVTTADSNVSADDILQYSHTNNLSANVVLGHTLLLVASLMQDPTFVARIQETYDSVGGRVDRDIQYLRENTPAGLSEDVLKLAENVRDAGGAEGQGDYFDRLVARLELVVNERDLIEENADILDDLLEQIDHLSSEVRGAEVPAVPTMDMEDTGDPGITANEILFGQSAALMGSNRALGQGMQIGIEAAFKEANDAGGVHGRQLKLTTEDDRYEPDAAFANTLEFVKGDEPVFALIGAVGTPTSRAALPVAQDAGVPFVGAFTGAQLLRGDELTNVLNYRASYYDETREMVESLSDAGVTKVAVLYQNDSYGVDGLSGVQAALAEQDGMDLVASWYYWRNTTAVNAAAFWISEAEPQAVIIVGTSAPAAEIIKKLRMKMDPDPTFLAVSFVGSNALATALGDDGEGVYVTQVVPLPSDASNAVVANYRAALSAYDSGAVPGFISLEGYLAGRMAISRLQACGANLSRECFLNVQGAATTIDIDGLQLTFGPGDNQGSDDVFLTVIGADGEYDQANAITR